MGGLDVRLEELTARLSMRRPGAVADGDPSTGAGIGALVVSERADFLVISLVPPAFTDIPFPAVVKVQVGKGR
jgi:hypothetical protein